MDNKAINEFIVDLIDVQGLDFSQAYPAIQSKYPSLARHAIRARYYRSSAEYQKRRSAAPVIEGVTSREKISVKEAMQRAYEEWHRAAELRRRKDKQSISFEAGPICLVFLADVHAGGMGVNYEKLVSEVEVISQTPGMYAVIVGDLVDQFVLGTLRNKQFNSRISIEEEWVIVRHILEFLAPKILVSVAGNHDNWSSYLIGVDYFKAILESVQPNALYDMHDCKFTINVGKSSWQVRARHKWLGRSQWNITHGIEKAAKFDQDFDIGVGGHTHESGVIRMFNNSGSMGYAILTGSYKEIDDYAEALGFPKPNGGTAMPLVFSDGGTCIPFENVNDAAEYMELAIGDGEQQQPGRSDSSF